MAPKKMAIINLSPVILREILQLPEGAEVIRVGMDDARGVLRVVVEGAGWDVHPGDRIQEAPTAVIFDSWSRPCRTIDWNLPKAIPVGEHNGVAIEPGKKYTFPPELVALPVREMAHGDHPMRHWDRTCPACNPEAGALTRIATDGERADGRPARMRGAC